MLRTLLKLTLAIAAIGVVALIAGALLFTLYPTVQDAEAARDTWRSSIKPVIGALRAAIMVSVIVFWRRVVAWMGRRLRWTDDEMMEIGSNRYRWWTAAGFAAVEILLLRNALGALLRLAS